MKYTYLDERLSKKLMVQKLAFLSWNTGGMILQGLQFAMGVNL